MSFNKMELLDKGNVIYFIEESSFRQNFINNKCMHVLNKLNY